MVGIVDKWHQQDEKAANSTEAPLSVQPLQFFVCLFSSSYLKLTPDV